MCNQIKESVVDFFKSVLYHTPKEKLNELEVNTIKQNGLIHFCYSKDVESILKEGVKGGLKAPVKNAEENYTWYYINIEKNFERNKKIVHSKGKRKNYDAYIVIKELTEEQINSLRIRRKYDSAVIYPETLKTDNKEAKYINK